MTQGVDSLIQPRYLYSDRTPADDSPSAVTEQYPSKVNVSSTVPNVCLVFSTENQVWWRSDFAGPSGCMRDRQNVNQRPLIEEPFSTDTDSQGLIKEMGGSMTYEGDAVFSRLETFEDGGEDPISYKMPRKTYVTGISQTGSAPVVLGVTADEFQTMTFDSGNTTLQQDLDPRKVWWGGNKNIEGTRLGYHLRHEDSQQITIEGLITEYRKRSRR